MGPLEVFHGEINATRAFVSVLERDFLAVIDKSAGFESTQCRAIVWAFGPLIDGLANTMRSIAVAAAKFFGRSLNPFLQDRVADRSTSTHHRIVTNYRLAQELLPEAPIFAVSDSRWDEVQAAIQIRNRVVHPKCLDDLTVSQADLDLIMTQAVQFLQDYAQFFQWLLQKEQKFIWQHMQRRRRLVPKQGRNAPCDCGSGKKYKHCCAAAQNVAV